MGRRGESGKRERPEVDHSLVADSNVLKHFASYATELDLKHDKYERIVKFSRDITIESKRIIFFLHSADKENSKHDLLKDADIRLRQLENTLFKSVGEELNGEDPYQFLRAYTSGLQEFVEACTFYQYLKFKKLEGWNCLQQTLKFNIDENSKEGCVNETSAKTCSVLMPPSEYVLGVADLTGELMRNCINCLGSGQFESCMETCAFVKEIYNGFLSVGNSGPKEFSRKLFTLKQSLHKMENACYTICVRGSEIPQNRLVDVLQDASEVFEEDEGFY
ncbi:hypothetical protein R5R35_003917 [Gryllus longicercus]